jgi:histidine triad (HIT) family protein
VTDCLFCSIVSGAIPADVVLRTDEVVAFRDINPAAPVHVLVIPVEHHATAAELGAANPVAAAAVLAAAGEVAALEGIAKSGYRMVFNSGAGAGQTVFHAHVHVMGGRDLTWPPG